MVSSEEQFIPNTISIYVYLFAIILVLFGSLNLGLIGLFNFTIIKGNKSFIRFIYILIGIASIYLALHRNTYLPFLGETVYPCYNLKNKIPANLLQGNSMNVKVQVPPFAKVVYWAADPESETMKVAKNPWIAYSYYENSGITTADNNGVATLLLNKPIEYEVGNIFPQKLNRHVHYRYCSSPGMLSEIKTTFI